VTFATLGEVLVEKGVISRSVYQRTLARALEKVICSTGGGPPAGWHHQRADAAFGLREQLLRDRCSWLFGRPQGTRYGYFDGSNFLGTGARSRLRVKA
jgi:hypothetical protein